MSKFWILHIDRLIHAQATSCDGCKKELIRKTALFIQTTPPPKKSQKKNLLTYVYWYWVDLKAFDPKVWLNILHLLEQVSQSLLPPATCHLSPASCLLLPASFHSTIGYNISSSCDKQALTRDDILLRTLMLLLPLQHNHTFFILFIYFYFSFTYFTPFFYNNYQLYYLHLASTLSTFLIHILYT